MSPNALKYAHTSLPAHIITTSPPFCSYENMGVAAVSCLSGCQCRELEIDATASTKVSIWTELDCIGSGICRVPPQCSFPPLLSVSTMPNDL